MAEVPALGMEEEEGMEGSGVSLSSVRPHNINSDFFPKFYDRMSSVDSRISNTDASKCPLISNKFSLDTLVCLFCDLKLMVSHYLFFWTRKLSLRYRLFMMNFAFDIS